MLLGRGTSAIPCLVSSHYDLTQNKQKKMDGWVDGSVQTCGLLRQPQTEMQLASSNEPDGCYVTTNKNLANSCL